MTDPTGPVGKAVRQNYSGNSNKEKSKAERPSREKVISGKVVQKPQGLGRKIADTFAGDDAKSVGSYILFDVVIPATKSMISDMVSQGIERLLFGDSKGRISRSQKPGGNTSYSSMYRGGSVTPTREMSYKARATHNFDEVILEQRGEAQTVIDELSELIDSFDVASVSDLYDMVGITGSHVDDKWGWTDIRGAEVLRVRDGYLLSLPRPIPLD